MHPALRAGRWANPSPSKIPTSTSFVSSGSSTSALSALVNRLIPFVEEAAIKIRLGIKEDT
jgi:hypothetical protein